MSNLLEKALMELSDGSREKMTDLTSITKRMTDLAREGANKFLI